MRIGAAEALSHHVADAQRLEHGAHRAAGDDAGAGSGTAQHNRTGAEMPVHIVVQRAAFLHRHANHGALGAIGRLADRFRHFTGLAGAVADAALLVAHHHQGGKGETTAALHHLGHAVDRDQLVDQVVATLVAAITIPAAAAAVPRFTRHAACPSPGPS